MKLKQYLIFIAIALIAIIAGVSIQQSQQKTLGKLESIIILPQAKTLQDVTFTDNKNQAFNLDSFKGKWTIVFFGFTNCPDVCPTTMQLLKQVKQKLTAENVWDNYRVVMITVDPERDSVQKLNDYVPYFDPEFIGLAANKDITEKFAKQLGILFFKSKEKNDSQDSNRSENYSVDHSTGIILLNPQAQMAGVIPMPHKLEQISADLTTLAQFHQDNKQAVIASSEREKQFAPQGDNNTQTASSNAANSNSSLIISNAWVRAAPPKAPSMAAYLDISNPSDKAITITGISSPEFGMSMVHRTQIEGGVSKMSHLKNLSIAANETVTLAPQGMHVMLMRPKASYAVGDTITLNLHTEQGQTITQVVTVKQAQ